MGLVLDKIKEALDEMDGLSAAEKRVLLRMYTTGRVSVADLQKAGSNPQYRKYIARLCEREVKEAYLYQAGKNDDYGKCRPLPIQRSTYKPINAGIFWTDVGHKQGYVLQYNETSGRYRILDDDGYWCGSGNGEVREKFERL